MKHNYYLFFIDEVTFINYNLIVLSKTFLTNYRNYIPYSAHYNACMWKALNIP